MLTIPDELESFLYVLLWHAVWYLRHNIGVVNAFHAGFFAERASHDHGKALMLRQGRISVNRYLPATTLEFTGLDDENKVTYTPLDNLVKHLAWLCHAQWLSWPITSMEAIHVEPPYLEGQSRWAPARPLPAKTIIPLELAKKMQDHSAVLKLFDDALKKPWTMNDYVGSRTKSDSVDAKPDGQNPDGAKKLADAQDPDGAKKPANARHPDGAKKPADAQCPDGAKKPADAAENVLQPMKVNGRKRAEPSKAAESLKPPRRNPVRAVRKGGPSPDERPARNPVRAVRERAPSPEELLARNPVRAVRKRAPPPDERPAKRRRRGIL